MKRNRHHYVGLAAMLISPLLSHAQGGVTPATWYRADAASLFSDAGSTASGDSTQVYQWNDSRGTGYNLLQATAVRRPIYSNSSRLANFNPTVTFDGSNDFMQFTAGTGVDVIDRATGTIVTAGYVNEQKHNGFVGFHPSMDYPGLHVFTDNKLLFFTGGPGYQGKSADVMAGKSFFTAGTGWENGAGSSASYAAATVSLNGTRTSYSGAQLNNANLSTGARDLRIGGDSNYGAFSGQLNEVLIFDDKLSVADLDKVESYLAIKYGTTYAAGTRDYKNASGGTVWTAASNAGYNKNIAGIANDGVLNQKQSWSTNSNREVLISTTGLTQTNAGNATALTAGQYLIWGDNGLSKTPSVEITGITGISHRFAAIWKVQNTSSVGTVRLAWVKSLSNLSLIQSDDATFTSADDVTNMSVNETTINGVVYNYADVTLNNGSYFTFAAKVAAPGGVTTGLMMWHKANDGVTTAGAKNIWQDISGNGRDVTQNNNVAYQPSLVTNATYTADSKNYSFNFNPFYYFDGTNDFFYKEGDLYFPSVNSPGSTYGVMFNSNRGGWNTPYGWADDDPNFFRWDDRYELWRDNGRALMTTDMDARTLPATIGGMSWKGNTINGVYMNINGKTYASTTTHIGTLNNNRTPANFAIGSEGHNVTAAGNEHFQGGIPEVFAYSVDHQNSTGSEKARINSYLAIKYGITLSDSAGTGVASYLNSNSDTVWNAITNTGYNSNIAGIAFDENSALHQKQSISNKAGQQLIVATTGLNNTNQLNAVSLTNGQFLLWGDNGLAQSLSTGFTFASLPDLNLRFSAIWKVQNTGTVGTVRVAWPEGIPSLHLIQSTNATFDDTDVFTDMTANTVVVNGITYNYADVTLNNGSYFTFAGYVVGPGNVASAAWYRADAMGQQYTDAGTTAATDSSLLYQWNEYKGTGYNLVQASAGDRPVFSNAQTLANFNPTVTFNGSQWMRYTATTGVNVIDRVNGSIYAAGKIKNLSNVGFAGFHASMDYPGLHTYLSGGKYKLLFFTGGPGYNGLSDSSFSRNQYFTIGSGWQNGDGSSSTYAGGTVSLNGFRKVYSGTSDFQNAVINDASRDFQIGEDNNHGPLNGQLNEVVVFENELSEDEMDRVETYLAIKYGTTYANGTRDYVNSSSTAVWNATDNAGYISNIAGIARDNQGSINQKQSWSTNPGQQVLISTTGLANTNAGNATSLADGQFLIWGDNGLAKNPSVAISAIADVNYRFAAIWKAENTNSVETVRVAWPKGLSNLKLIQSTDATIDGTDDVTDMGNTQTINGVEYAYADVILTNGQYFTFAAFIQAPGGVTNGLSHWYRADKYAQASGEGADITAWTDFTSGVTSEQVDDIAVPKYRLGDTTYFNFNPGVNFTNANQALANLDVQTVSGLNYDIFTLTKEGVVAGGNGRIFSSLVNNADIAGSINYWDGIGIMADNRLERMNTAYSNRYLANPGSIDWATNTPSIMYNRFSDTTAAKALNGKAIGTIGTHSARGLFNGGHSIGTTQFPGNGSDNAGFTGNIGELIIYGAGSITTAERNKVDAYLAIKYGVTLDTANNYTTSQDVVVWNKALNKGFYNNVAGIGNDYISALHQKQSRSQRTNTNGQIIMSLNELAATNAANTGSVEDGQFLLWGDNNITQAMTATASTYTTFSYAGGTNNGRRMNRIWKVQNTNVDQSMQILFPRSSVGTTTLPVGDACGAYAMLFADDSAMTTNLVAIPLGTTADSVQFIVSHAFPNGMSYFSFGKVTPLDNGNIYLPSVVESTVEYDNNCGVGEWVSYHQTGNVSEKMFGTAGFAAADLDSLQLTITPDGTSYDDGVRITNLMPRITHVADSNTSTLPVGKVRVYYSADELAGTSVPGYITQGWFKYDGDADAVLADIYGDGLFEAGKAVQIIPAATGVEDGVNYVEFHGVSSFSSFVYLSSTEDLETVLPVNMLYFKAEKQQANSLLTWATATEVNSSGFVIERSKDARNWTELGFVASKANSGAELSYSFLDEKPMSAENFYRLKQLDIDGAFEYSQVQLVRFDKAHQLQIVPNPANANFVIKGLRGNNTIAMANVAGQVLVTTRTEGVAEKLIQVSHLPAGTYFVTVMNDDGSSEVHKVVKD